MGSKYCPAVCDIRLYQKTQEIQREKQHTALGPLSL